MCEEKKNIPENEKKNNNGCALIIIVITVLFAILLGILFTPIIIGLVSDRVRDHIAGVTQTLSEEDNKHDNRINDIGAD